MTFLANIFLLVFGGFVLQYWWQSGEFKNRALALALRHCQQLNLQLLDQSMVIRGYWPVRREDGRWLFRRTYQFEFTSTGQQRYRGNLVMMGFQLDSMELETYQLPESQSGS